MVSEGRKQKVTTSLKNVKYMNSSSVLDIEIFLKIGNTMLLKYVLIFLNYVEQKLSKSFYQVPSTQGDSSAFFNLFKSTCGATESSTKSFIFFLP